VGIALGLFVVRNGAGVVRNGAGVVRNGAGVVRNGAGVVRNGAGVVRACPVAEGTPASSATKMSSRTIGIPGV
jgi:hypothetical protein